MTDSKEMRADNARIATIEARNARLVEVLKVVLQHGRIDDSEERMNMVAEAISYAAPNAEETPAPKAPEDGPKVKMAKATTGSYGTVSHVSIDERPKVWRAGIAIMGKEITIECASLEPLHELLWLIGAKEARSITKEQLETGTQCLADELSEYPGHIRAHEVLPSLVAILRAMGFEVDDA